MAKLTSQLLMRFVTKSLLLKPRFYLENEGLVDREGEEWRASDEEQG